MYSLNGLMVIFTLYFDIENVKKKSLQKHYEKNYSGWQEFFFSVIMDSFTLELYVHLFFVVSSGSEYSDSDDYSEHDESIDDPKVTKEKASNRFAYEDGYVYNNLNETKFSVSHVCST